ncbi:MAG TPA: hypothetical protein VG326_18270 [Tepidisphaeraceae bacterium]|jgi:flagellin-like hook-associated protein FlgL|nr:hypothetical protein [Tepidisphaeraceae bacterium]
MTISPLQLARIPDLLSSQTTTSALNTVQKQLADVEEQLSSGNQFSQPSENLVNATVTLQLQRTVTQKQTYLTNISSAQSQLGEVDNSLSSLTSLVQQAQTIASSDVNSDVTPSQRQADAQVIDSIYSQVLNVGNTQYNSLYLFGGDKNTSPPFVTNGGGIQFNGSTTLLQNSVDVNTDVPFMVSSADVFGAASSQVQGTADLTPDLTPQTRLSDLRGSLGNGVQLGAIQIGNGTTSKIVDLTHADDVSDVVNAINAAGMGGITASIAGGGISLVGAAGDNITVNDVAGDTTAGDLGILRTAGNGAGVALVGSNTEPNVTVFTPLSSLKGGAGIDLSGLKITNGAHSANVSFSGDTTVGDLLNSINSAGVGVTAELNTAGDGINIVNPIQGTQMTIAENGGTSAADLGVNSFSPQTLLSQLNGGQGVGLASGGAPDFQITRSDGTSFSVSVAGASTVQDVIDKINAASGGVGVTAGFSATTNGITLADTAGGAGTLSIESLNASTAATDLGLTSSPATGGVITGSDVNPIASSGVFTDLANLRDALNSGDQAKITLAAQGLQNDYNKIVQARGAAGAQVQELQSRQDQITTENTATQSLMSQLSDTDFTAAITQFQTLQTALQATLETSARTLNESLLNFLG